MTTGISQRGLKPAPSPSRVGSGVAVLVGLGSSVGVGVLAKVGLGIGVGVTGVGVGVTVAGGVTLSSSRSPGQGWSFLSCYSRRANLPGEFHSNPQSTRSSALPLRCDNSSHQQLA